MTTTMRANAVHRNFARAWLALGYAFLYLPIVALVVYSFNDSPGANVWRDAVCIDFCVAC